MQLQTYFRQLADFVQGQLSADEGFTLWFSAECSDFVRFNHGKVRQAGQVKQAYLDLQLQQGQRHVSQSLALGLGDDDQAMLRQAIQALRAALADVVDDPYLLLNEQAHSSERVEPNTLPSSERMVEEIVLAAAGSDLVGLLAAGPIYYGFANHHGQRNWQETASWNFDWSLYSHGDKAVKRGAAGFQWDGSAIAASIAEARQQLELLAKPAKSLSPGQYRAYLCPSALAEILSTLSWGGFSEKDRRTKRSGLMKLYDGEQALSPLLHLTEANAAGLAPMFQRQGFIKPDQVPLIAAGQSVGTLVSPRSAKEYGLSSNGAGGGEGPESLVMTAGTLPMADALQALSTGLYLGNLHYLNYADRAAGRLTGMTRFACFWVENGEIVAPLNVMRFDDSIYRLLGSELEALTIETEFQADPMTYEARSSASMQVPGALLRSFNLVL